MAPPDYTRFSDTRMGDQFPSEYDIDSRQIADNLQRGIAPFVVTTIDLSVAGSRVLNIPGRAFVAYYFQTNTSNDARQSSGLISVAINNDGSQISQTFSAKHNRGFRGSFALLNLTWLAQANTSVRFIVHKSSNTPWMTDDSDTATGGGVSSIATTSPLATTGGSTPTLSISNTGSAAQFLAGPTGAGGAVTERLIVPSDIPTLNQNTTGSAGSATTAVSVTGTNVVTNSNLAQAPANTLKGNNTGATANDTDLTTAQVNTLLGTITSLTTDVAATGAGGASVATIQANVVTNAKAAQMPANTIKGNNTGATANATDLTVSQLKTLTNSAPTVQKFLSGSGTYTTPANALYLRVRMVGGGGGGGQSGTALGTAPTAGGNTTFGTTLLVANGGGFGNLGSTGGVGGTASLGSAIGIALLGGSGGGANFNANAGQTQFAGANGAASALGGEGQGGAVAASGNTASTNTGSGGGGGGSGSTNAIYCGCGGGAGGFVDAILSTPLATYAYAVGAAGAAGLAGTSGTNGGAGSAGIIEVTEFYQ